MATLDQKTIKYYESLRADQRYQAHIRNRDYRFITTWGLFSPKSLDEGTGLLIDYLEVEADDHCLDLGCGYGPIGLVMANLAQRGSAMLVDKDYVAIDYARRNALLNRIENVDIRLSNGFSAVPQQPFQVIASNLPAKSGKELYYLYFFDAFQRMPPGARFYVVTINGLRRYIERSFKELFGNYRKLKQGRQYTVAMAERE